MTAKKGRRRRLGMDDYMRMTDGISEETARRRHGSAPEIPADPAMGQAPLPKWAPTRQSVPKGATCGECGKPIERNGRGEVWRESRTGAWAHRHCGLAARGRANAADAL